MEKVPCVVIGAGAIGLAIGRALSQTGLTTLVLERNSIFGAENSSRNSEVLHAGLYYVPNSWKARLCNEGKNSILKYLQERNIPHSICGKLVVAASEAEVPILQKIKLNGEMNGLTDLRMLSKEETRALEPELSAHAAMLSPSTGIMDSHTLMLTFVADIEDGGSNIVYDCEVESASLSNGGFEVQTSQGPVQCDHLVNAAGMHAPFLAGRMAFYPRGAIPPVYFAKGNYFKLQGARAPFRRLIYPIPAAGGLGVHATLDLQGRVKFGPNVEWLQPGRSSYSPGGDGPPSDSYQFPVDVPPPSDFSVSQRSGSADTGELFCREVARYWPAVRRDMLVPDYAGIRPKLCGPAPSPPPAPATPSHTATGPAGAGTGTGNTATEGAQAQASSGASSGAEGPSGGAGGAGTGSGSGSGSGSGAAYHMPASADFAILGSAAHRVPGLVCVFGAESPGLTASLAIARHVRDLLLSGSGSGSGSGAL